MQFEAKSFVFSTVILHYRHYEFENERITFVDAAKTFETTSIKIHCLSEN